LAGRGAGKAPNPRTYQPGALLDGSWNVGETNPGCDCSDVHGFSLDDVSTSTIAGNDYSEDLPEADVRSGDGKFITLTVVTTPLIFSDRTTGLDRND